MTIIFLAVGLGIIVASAVAFAATTLMPDPSESVTEDRLSALAARGRGQTHADEEDRGSLLMAGGVEDASSALNALVNAVPAVGDLLDQADVKISPQKFTLACLALFIVGVAAALVTPVPWYLGPFLGAALAMLPVGYVMFMRSRRLSKFGLQMPAALELLGRSLRAGHSLQAGFGLVGSEMQAPLATEFARAFEEQNLGIPLDEALEDMSDHIPNMDLRFFATSVILQRQTGGDLAEILDKISDLIRERLQIQGQIKALTGEGRMSGGVLLALPPLLFVVMLKLNYDYVMMLFTDEAGRYMLAAGIVSQILGALMIKKIITIKV